MNKFEKDVHEELVNLAMDNLIKDPPDLEAATRILKAAILKKHNWEDKNE